MKLEADGVSFRYGDELVLDDVSLGVPEGELVGLLGPNGAGKSTLLRCLHGSIRPVSGAVRVEGRDLRELTRREIARTIGAVPQQCVIAFPVSVRHFVGLGRFAREPRFAGPSRADRVVVDACLDVTATTRLAERLVDELSGGEFRRVLIAQALAQEPRVLLLDEPVQQLDLLHQLEVMEFARAFARRTGNAAVVSLHDLGLAARYCGRVVVLNRGRVAADGAPHAVLTAALLRDVWGVDAAIEPSPATDGFHVVPIRAAAHDARGAHSQPNALR